MSMRGSTVITRLAVFTLVCIGFYERALTRNPKSEIPNVLLPTGTVLGTVETSPGGRLYYVFRSIPYAEPPVGERRFKPPVPATASGGVANHLKWAPSCPQVAKEKQLRNIKEMMGEEDCLYLNVFTPSMQENNYPVMVYIHGGAFLTGNASRHNPELFLDHDIVVVTIQYRLGVLGFLSTEDEALPGNLGLMDQTLALRWVHENIARFGGDVKRVTVCGLSAGAASAHMHLFNPHAKGLFSRAILMSGSALCPWALRKGHRKVAMAVGEKFNCQLDPQDASGVEKSKRLVECLRSAPLKELVSSFMDFQVWNSLPWETVPRVDGDYLPDHPARLLAQGRFHDASIVTGVNLHEGRLVTQGMFSNPEVFRALAIDFDSIAPSVALLFQEGDYWPRSLARRAFEYYLGGTEISASSHADEVALTKLFGDRFFKIPHDDTWNLTWRHLGPDRVFAYELMHSRGEECESCRRPSEGLCTRQYCSTCSLTPTPRDSRERTNSSLTRC
ncbi:cholinesterase 1-like isoform X2 [Penaeus monodon]|uniref:cholinesterase 1-like isoform X2 n=1 Tax=Penaeus monodon TaxID=6687 RepID=UPI0018A70587|nr:cholinesterase 1-like isoform X2 [Penaeus monodon]